MTQLLARATALGPLRGADLELSPGRYVCLSSESEALRSLVAVLTGVQRPRSGQVLVDGVAPASNPQARRKLAALLPEEALPPARSIASAVARVLGARGDSAAAGAALLAAAGLSHLATLAPAALGQRELRSVALVLALAHDSADALVLHEPLTTLLPAAFVLAGLDRHTARGAIVLATTSSAADASSLGGRLLCLDAGRVSSSESATPRLGAGPWQQVVVETSDAQALSRVLHESSQGLTTQLGATPHALTLSGPALDVTVQALIRLARQHGLEIQRIEAATPPVEALLAARAGFARGAYEASRVAVLAAQAPSPATAAPPAAEQIIQTPRSSYPPEPS